MGRAGGIRFSSMPRSIVGYCNIIEHLVQRYKPLAPIAINLRIDELILDGKCDASIVFTRKTSVTYRCQFIVHRQCHQLKNR